MEIASGEVHAYLITGAAAAKRQEFFLRNFAKKAKVEVDLFLVEPEEKRRTIGIDQVRSLLKKIQLKSFSGKTKTVFFPCAELLTLEAQSALLKTLEEPPKNTLLILSAPNSESLLPTVSSRCAVYRLTEKAYPELEADEIINLLQQSRGKRLVWVEKNLHLFGDKARLLESLNLFARTLRHLLLISQGCQKPKGIYDGLKINHSLKNDLPRAIRKVQEVYSLVASTNVSPRLALEVLLLDLPQF